MTARLTIVLCVFAVNVSSFTAAEFSKFSVAGKENLKVLQRISLELPISEDRKKAIETTAEVWNTSVKNYKDSSGKEKVAAYRSVTRSHKVLLSELKAVCEELKIISDTQLSGLNEYIYDKNPSAREKEKFIEIYELSRRENRQAQITYHAAQYRYAAQQFERAIKLSRKVFSITGTREPDKYFFKVDETGEKVSVKSANSTTVLKNSASQP
jgi:hypothetical protein